MSYIAKNSEEIRGKIESGERKLLSFDDLENRIIRFEAELDLKYAD